jgi:hypothetical protein
VKPETHTVLSVSLVGGLALELPGVEFSQNCHVERRTETFSLRFTLPAGRKLDPIFHAAIAAGSLE